MKLYWLAKPTLTRVSQLPKFNRQSHSLPTPIPNTNPRTHQSFWIIQSPIFHLTSSLLYNLLRQHDAINFIYLSHIYIYTTRKKKEKKKNPLFVPLR